MRIYLDNAATTPMHPEVIATMAAVMAEDFGNPSSIHRHGRITKSIIEQARKTCANLINASLGELFFTGSATEANNMILKNSVLDLGVKRIVSSPTEHPCVLESLRFLREKHATEIIMVKIDGNGNVDLAHLENILSDCKTKTLVSVMHANNEIGTMSNPHLIGKICQSYSAIYHCDAVQTITKYPIDVQAMGIHFLSATAHKFHGPKGCGFVFISNDHIISPFIHGGAQERNMRAGTENISGIVGMAKAIDITNINREQTIKHIKDLRQYIKYKIDALSADIQYNGNQDINYADHILSVSFPPSPKADMLVMNLDIAGISASSASACSAGIEEDSHVMQAIGHPSERKTIRFSFSSYNTRAEIDYLLDKMAVML
jgi:cysteine desulfurase